MRKPIIAILVPVSIASAIAAWRDLDRRTDAQVRGTKKFWRVLMLLNTGNSLFYWLFGRRA